MKKVCLIYIKSFNRLKCDFFDFLILVSLRTFRGMVYLFWSNPKRDSSPTPSYQSQGKPMLLPEQSGLYSEMGVVDQNNLQCTIAQTQNIFSTEADYSSSVLINIIGFYHFWSLKARQI